MVHIRRIAVGLLMLALTMGSGWQTCAMIAQPHPALATMTEATSSHDMTHHDHMTSADHSSQHSHHKADHACLKCCASCMMASATPLTPEWTITRAVTRVSFAPRDEQLRGHIVFVDPEIPKLVG